MTIILNIMVAIQLKLYYTLQYSYKYTKLYSNTVGITICFKFNNGNTISYPNVQIIITDLQLFFFESYHAEYDMVHFALNNVIT